MDIMALCALATLALDPPESGLVGVTYGGNLISINHTTGAAQLVGSTGFFNLNALEMDLDGRLIAGAASDPLLGVSQFLELNLMTGRGALLGTHSTPDSQLVRSLAFAPNGTMYFVSESRFLPSSPHLYSATAPETAAQAVSIGATETGIQGMTFSASGVLYGWNIVQGLGIMNPQTAVWVDVNPGFAGPGMQSIAFGPDGTLYGVGDPDGLSEGGVNNNLFTINLTTGQTNLIGPLGFNDVRGLAWVPGPSAIGLFVLSWLGAKRRRRV